MLINCDAKGLEIVCAAFLSKDKVLYKELLNGIDTHGENQKRFNLPSRLIAKTFVFRLIYGGSAYSYANDPDFAEVKGNESFWQGVIDEFYNKYTGVKAWHDEIYRTATQDGRLCMPTGRIYNFESTLRRGTLEWPRTKILNYPVQGLGADIMSLIRVSFHKRFKAANISGEEISTIHDSIVVDAMNHEVQRTVELFYEVFNDLPVNFKRVFGVEFDLPLLCEISYGMNKLDLTEHKKGSIIVV